MNGGTKKIRIALVTNGATVSHEDVDVTLPTVTAFGQNLRDRIHGQYAGADARKPLDVRWLFSGESGQPVADEESFPARAQYLATLPGDLSRQLLATVDVPIKVDTLFTFDGSGTPSPKADAVYLAPVTVVTSEGTSEIKENPKKLAANPQLFRTAYADVGSLTVGAFGPGFELKRLITPASSSAVFDLTSYWMPVDAGDARLTRLEDLLESALDPFGHTRRQTGDQIDAPEGRKLAERRGGERLIDINPLAGHDAEERGRRDADDPRGLVVDPDGAADRARVAAQSARPEAVTDHDRRLGARAIVRFDEGRPAAGRTPSPSKKFQLTWRSRTGAAVAPAAAESVTSIGCLCR